jgi:cysteine desulfurase
VVGVDRHGRYDADEVAAAVQPDTILVSVQLANHEVGTVQPVEKVCALLQDRDAVLVHVDACAAVGYVPVAFRELGADLCSITAHKFGGPAGAGALLVRRGLRVDPMIVGGAQERARRGGLENVAAWVGFGAACEALDVEGEAARERALIATASTVVDRVAGVVRYGDASPGGALPHLLCLGVGGVEAEPILLALDQHGVAVHSGSSCSSETLEPSPVLAAMGVDAEHSLRISVGWSSDASDVGRFVDVFPGIVERLRGLRSS